MRRRSWVALVAVAVLVVAGVGIGVAIASQEPPSTTLVVHLVDPAGKPITKIDGSVVVELTGQTPSKVGVERYAAPKPQNCYKHHCSSGWVGAVRGGVATFRNLPSKQTFTVEATVGHAYLESYKVGYRVAHLETRSVKLTMIEGGTISGTVRSLSGAPIAGVVVGAVDSTGHIVHRSTTKSDGRYRIVGLLNGNYRVLFNAKPFGDTVPLRAYTPEYSRPPEITTPQDAPGYDPPTTLFAVKQATRRSAADDITHTDGTIGAGPTTTVHVHLPLVAAKEPTVLYFTGAHASDSQSVGLSPSLTVTVRLAVGSYHLVTYGPPARGQDGDDDTAYWFGGDGRTLVKTRARSTLLVVDGSGDQTIEFGASR